MRFREISVNPSAKCLNTMIDILSALIDGILNRKVRVIFHAFFIGIS